MIILKKAINRRTILRGFGTALALPLLDSMVPALTAFQKTAAKPVNRLGVVYVPNGMTMKNWTPATDGAAYELTPILKPLEPFRNRMLVLSGLNSLPPVTPDGQDGGPHSRASTRFLTDIPPKFAAGGSELLAGISMDQIAALEFSQHTQLASLELGLEGTESAGACDPGYSCAYTSTISWRSPTTPLPTEFNPRAVFERLFGDNSSTDPAARLASMRQQKSVLDSVSQKVAKLEGDLGAGDRTRLREFLEAIRDVERRIQKAEEQNSADVPLVEHPAGVPATYEEHAKLMYDLYILAYQTDMTRVVTFMFGREFSGQTYPQIGVPDSHHPISHYAGDQEKLAKLSKINTYHTKLFADFLAKMQATPDGDGSLLDHSMIIYGAGMSDSNSHNPKNLPVLLLGGGAGTLKGGRHVIFPKDTPLANLHLTLLDKLGLRSVDKMGDSTGPLTLLSDV